MTYDCFTFFNEFDILEIRLNILDPYVDYFVIAESTETFSGKSKPLNFWLNSERFAKWSHKILHLDVERKEFPNAFQRAFYQKESIMDVLKARCKDDDIVYFGDVDEIWKPQIPSGNVCKLKQLNYSYYLNNRSSEQWFGTIFGKWGEVKKKGLNWNRANPSHYREDSGWHFTNMGGVEQILKKLDAYDHQEFNTGEIKAQLKERIANGEDYVGRSVDWLGVPFSFTVDEIDLPQYLLDNKETWKKLFL